MIKHVKLLSSSCTLQAFETNVNHKRVEAIELALTGTLWQYKAEKSDINYRNRGVF